MRNELKEILLQIDRYSMYNVHLINDVLLVNSNIPLINENLMITESPTRKLKKSGLYIIDGTITTKNIVSIIVVYLYNSLMTFEIDIEEYVLNLPDNNLLKQLYIKENKNWVNIINCECNTLFINNMSDTLYSNLPNYYKRNTTERTNKAALILSKALFEISYDAALHFSYTALSYKHNMFIKYILQCENMLGIHLDDVLKERFNEFKVKNVKKVKDQVTSD